MKQQWSVWVRWAVRGAVPALAAAVLAGCATTELPPAPTAAASPDYNYLIGPGDTVNIVVWRNPELSQSVPVRPDGKITAPLIEDLVAQGKDSTDARARDREAALQIRSRADRDRDRDGFRRSVL